MDELGFCLVPPLPYGWQFVVETIEIPGQRNKRLHVLGIMSRNNHLESYVSTQSFTAEVVIAWIDAFFPAPKQRTVIVLDQASIHTSAGGRKKLSSFLESGVGLKLL